MSQPKHNPHGQFPAVGVGGIIVEDGNVLLIQRGREPGKGLWSIPGGRLTWGESLEQAVEREVFEETGLKVEVVKLAGISELRSPADASNPDFHYILIDYICRVVSGEPVCSDDAADIRWQPLDRLDELPTTEGLSQKLKSWISAQSL